MSSKTENRKIQILDTALTLFNQNGILGVSTRDIAKALNISQGNLTYHFPKKDDLVETLYNRLIEDLTQRISDLLRDSFGLAFFYHSIRSTFALQRQYKCFFTETMLIIQHFPNIATQFRELLVQRKLELEAFLQMLQELGYLRADISNAQMQSLQAQITIVSNFWQQAADVMGESSLETDAQLIERYANVSFDLMRPYFTELAQAEIATFI